MQTSFQRIATGVVIFTLTVVAAVTGYVIAGWTLLDAIYMVVITIFGVGYGEVQPLSSIPLKVFTILVIIAGALSVAYTVSGFVQLITEGEIRKHLTTKRMNEDIQLLEDHVIICGFGRIGQMVARQLKAAHQPFVVLDNDPDRIELAREQGYLMCLGNATDETNLEAVRIQKARILATVLPNDAANVFITLTAREMNPQLIILARGEIPSTEKKLRLAGADHVVLPATISAARMTHLITNPYAVDFFIANGWSSQPQRTARRTRHPNSRNPHQRVPGGGHHWRCGSARQRHVYHRGPAPSRWRSHYAPQSQPLSGQGRHPDADGSSGRHAQLCSARSHQAGDALSRSPPPPIIYPLHRQSCCCKRVSRGVPPPLLRRSPPPPPNHCRPY